VRITALHSFMQRVGDRPRLLVRVDTDEGISGWGEAYNHGPDRALPPVLEYLFPQIEGLDPRRIEFIALKLLQSSRFPPGAIGLAAISAIEHALWDISGKAAGLPVFMLLGGHARDRVRVYLGVYTAPDPAEAIGDMRRVHADHGITAFKMSPFRRDLHLGRWGQVCDAAAGVGVRLRRPRQDLRADPGDPTRPRPGCLRPDVPGGADPPRAHPRLGPTAPANAGAAGDRRVPLLPFRVPGTHG